MGKAAAFQPLQTAQQRIRREVLTQTSLSMSSLQERKVVTGALSSSSNNRSGLLVLDPLIVCGPSGVGKGTIIQTFMEEYRGRQDFGFTVSHTSRAARVGEENGVHYHFTSITSMHELIRQGHFVEHAIVHDNVYGTSWASMQAVQDNGFRCLLDIDTQGVQRIKAMQDEATKATSLTESLNDPQQQLPYLLQPKYVFIAPPSIETLRKRLLGRATESEESLQRRVGNAAQEVAYGLTAGIFDAVVYNDDLEQACRDFDRTVRELYNL
jgi:guanylate kinase